jgi:hypothetical protein
MSKRWHTSGTVPYAWFNWQTANGPEIGVGQEPSESTVPCRDCKICSIKRTRVSQFRFRAGAELIINTNDKTPISCESCILTAYDPQLSVLKLDTHPPLLMIDWQCVVALGGDSSDTIIRHWEYSASTRTQPRASTECCAPMSQHTAYFSGQFMSAARCDSPQMLYSAGSRIPPRYGSVQTMNLCVCTAAPRATPSLPRSSKLGSRAVARDIHAPNSIHLSRPPNAAYQIPNRARTLVSRPNTSIPNPINP